MTLSGVLGRERLPRPTPVVATAAAGVVVLLLLPVDVVAGVVAAIGGLGVVAGGTRNRPPLVHGGAVGLLAGLFIASQSGYPPGLVLVGTVASVLAWDAGDLAVTLDEQLTPSARTARAEAVHLGATAVATAGLAAVCYAVWLFGRGALPSVSAPILAFGAVLFGIALAWSGD